MAWSGKIEKVSNILSVIKTENIGNSPKTMSAKKRAAKSNRQKLPSIGVLSQNINTKVKKDKFSLNFSEDNDSDGENSNVPPHLKNASMQRRNARERNRVRFLNLTFDVLRQHLPQHRVNCAIEKQKNKKMSKVDTLHAAIDYIQDLKDLLDDTDAVEAALQNQDPREFREANLLSPCGSLSSAGSPHTNSDGTITSEEEGLLGISNWLEC